ncbi:hypothetical protein [Sporisorium scitamineum]|uniref:Uncharacterized protein n=1 Tax=Sporisorium scitamineum TaxID=49012 RepID=A0A0F7RYL6_9BASI|nr:hypothetical protein [Sporisorium scitamineum]
MPPGMTQSSRLGGASGPSAMTTDLMGLLPAIPFFS